MEITVICPGSFCPPTYGHVEIAKRAAEVFSHVHVICTTNLEKDEKWFTEDECAEMWSAYHLPKNASVHTFSSFAHKVEPRKVVMVRGIRKEADFEEEKRVLIFNKKKFGIDKCFYIWSDCRFEEFSSTKVRKMVKNLELENLHNYVSPLVTSKLLEKVLDIKNIFLVVGRPGSGKTTFLRLLSERNEKIAYINTDEYLEKLKPLLRQEFPNEDLVQLALTKEEELKEVIRKPFFELLKVSITSAKGKKHVFVEVPYGLMEDKKSYRHLGGKVIYIGCDEDSVKKRINGRGTPEHLPFLEKIPGEEETKKIARENNLKVVCIDTSGTIQELEEKAEHFLSTL